MPALHKLPAQDGTASIELVQCRSGNTANKRRLHCGGCVLVRLIEQSLQSRGAALPEQANDPLVTVRQVLGELDEAASHREQSQPRITNIVEDSPRVKLHIVDGQTEVLEIFFVNLREKGNMPHTALVACGLPSPRSHDVFRFQPKRRLPMSTYSD